MDAGDRSDDIVLIGLAEFASVRSEMEQKFRTHDTMLSLNFTLNAGLVGVVMADKAPTQLLVVVPLLSTGLTLLARQQLTIANVLSGYISDVLHPLLAQQVGNRRVLRFEH